MLIFEEKRKKRHKGHLFISLSVLVVKDKKQKTPESLVKNKRKGDYFACCMFMSAEK